MMLPAPEAYIREERILYAYRFLPSHLKDGGEIQEMHDLLSNLEFLQNKLTYFDVELVLSDFDLVETRTDLKLVGAGIRKSAHTIRATPTSFLREVIGRLLWDSGDNAAISNLIKSAYNLINGPSLVPLTPVLMAADEPLIRSYQGHRDKVIGVALSKDGRLAASGSLDGTLKLWDVREGHLIRDLLNIIVGGIEFSPNKNTIFVGTLNAVIEVNSRGDVQQVYAQRRGIIGLVRLSNDGKRLLGTNGSRVLSENNSIAVWDTSSGQLLCVWDVEETQIVSLDISQDSNIAVGGFTDGRIRVLDLKLLRELSCRLPRFLRIGSICVFNRTVVVAAYGIGSETQISAWSLLTDKMMWHGIVQNDIIRSINVDNRGRLLVATGSRGYIYILDLSTGKTINRFTGDGQEILAITISRDGSFIFAGLQNGLLRSWEIFTPSRIEPSVEISEELIALDTCNNGTMMVTGNRDGIVSAHNIFDQNVIRQFKQKKPIDTVAISPKCELVVISQESNIVIRSLRNGRRIRVLRGHEGDVSACCFSRQGDVLVSGDSVGVIRIWDLTNGKCILTIQAHKDKIRAIDISEDHHVILSGSDDKSACLWDYITGQHLATMTHGRDVTSIASALQKGVIFTGGDDGIVRQWWFENNKVASSQIIVKLPSWILGVSVSLDERYALFHSFDGSLVWWNIEGNEQFDTIHIEDRLWTSKISGDGSVAVAGGTRLHILKLLR